MAYEVWSTLSASLLAAYETEEDALAAVRREIRAHGRRYAAGFALAYENGRGRTRAIAEGQALVQRALAAARKRAPARPGRVAA